MMSEEEIIHKIQSIANSLYFQGFIKDNNGEISKCLNNFLDLYNKEKETLHFIQSQLDITNAKLIEEKEKNIQKDYISKDKIREKIEDKISICRCEELEDMGLNDVHGKYWSMYRRLLEKLLKELLEE